MHIALSYWLEFSWSDAVHSRHPPLASARVVLLMSCHTDFDGVAMRVISEGPSKVTRATVEAAWRRRSVGKRLIIRDLECRGLALIVNQTSMAWSCSYRPRGTDPLTGRRWPNRTVTLGNPATHSPDQARIEANRLKGLVASGVDPVLDKQARAAAQRRRLSATLGRLLNDYGQALPRRPKLRGGGLPSEAYVTEELTQVRLALVEMDAEATPAADLTDVEIRKLFAGGGGPSTPRKRFGALSRFLDWCQDAGHVSANPCALIGRARRPKPSPARSHYLTLEELARLWKAAEELPHPVWRDLARFLIAVPCRKREASRLSWADVDLSASEWRQPGRLTKNRDPHRLHLHPMALAILRERCRAAGFPQAGLVFPAPNSGKPVETFSDMKAALVKTAGLEGWTWHDLRRSFATALGESGTPEVVADAVLNHRQAGTRGGVLGVYQRASRWPEQVRAMQSWGTMLDAALTGAVSIAEVVPMRRQKLA